MAVLAVLAGCHAPPGPASPATGAGIAPPFAAVPYEPFTRAEAIAIALREWRAFGQPVHDEPPDERPPPAPQDKPERQPGLWERVGEYWWLGLDGARPEAAWTGKHDEAGTEFDAARDGSFAWSAAFISYVMRNAGAGGRFPYAAAHATYINIARQMTSGETAGWAVRAAAPQDAAPQPGDLVCYARDGQRTLRYADLPARRFPGHCDIVVATAPGMLSVIGGNVDDAVSLKHVPVTAEGHLADPAGQPVDPRYPWFVVVLVDYDR